jgi:hypothetical protein
MHSDEKCPSPKAVATQSSLFAYLDCKNEMMNDSFEGSVARTELTIFFPSWRMETRFSLNSNETSIPLQTTLRREEEEAP